MYVSKDVRCGLLVCAFAVLTTACASNPAAPSTSGASNAVTSAESVAGSWKLQSFTLAGSSAVVISTPERFTLEFADNNRVTMRVDCNRATGSYAIAGGALTVGPLAMTK